MGMEEPACGGWGLGPGVPSFHLVPGPVTLCENRDISFPFSVRFLMCQRVCCHLSRIFTNAKPG